ncbi:crossover junction endonuclease EME1 [Blastomyces parvus]|uniref:Crossover junction endonuclease EME1 n=1 Tax=Blastomyces parvus TaxID=2060905 RepID=A0A2B7XLV0_9EURO|nr:crossover junction endonuclease EME1 [Blastomyces parvus]
MPEVISLLSSSSPLMVRSSPAPNVSSKLPTRPARIPILSDDSIFDWEDSNPSKKRRLSHQRDLSPPPLRQPNPPSKINPSLLFSDLEECIISSPITGLNNDYHSMTKHSTWNGDVSDPIEFTSSAVDPTTAHTRDNIARKTPAVITIDDSIIESDELSSPGGPLNVPPPATLKANLSNRTASLLARIQNRSSAEPTISKQRGASTSAAKSIPFSSRAPVPKSSQRIDLDEDSLPVVPMSKPRRAPKASTAEREMREAEKQATKERREREKEEERERKQKLKEQKAKEKQLAADLAEANKRKFDKKISTPEMIIDMSSTFEGSSVGNQVTEYMRHLGVEKNVISAHMPNIVTWRRKVTAQYNDKEAHWEPCPIAIKMEDHVLCLLLAQEFVDMSIATTNGDDTLDSHVLTMKRTYPGCKPIYLIEGLSVWMRKNNNSRNRAYQASVLRELESSSQPQQQQQPPKRQKKPKQTVPPPPPIDDDTIEDALLQLQVQHGCLIQHTAAPSESAEWIKNFTEHISTVPYRQELINLHDASFCMDVGQVKSGEDNRDTYVKMLQEVHRVTAPISYGITSQYPTVSELVRELKEQGPLLLEDVKKCANRNGALTDARVGPAISKRLHKVFTGLNPASTDI